MNKLLVRLKKLVEETAKKHGLRIACVYDKGTHRIHFDFTSVGLTPANSFEVTMYPADGDKMQDPEQFLEVPNEIETLAWKITSHEQEGKNCQIGDELDAIFKKRIRANKAPDEFPVLV